MRICFVITGLSVGGAENMLYKLLSNINRARLNPTVISLSDKGIFGEKIEALDIPVYVIAINSGTSILLGTIKIIRIINTIKPDLVQGWMYHGNLAASLASMSTVKVIPMVWNVRHSLYSLKYEKKGTAIIIKLLSYFSKFPRTIIYNSITSANQHERFGYSQSKSLIIANGFDTNIFKPDRKAYISLRQELNLTKDTFIIGLVARFHPMKDHHNFLQAAAILLKNKPDIHFILVGRNVDSNKIELVKLIHKLNIQGKTHLLGERQDISSITTAMDIASNSSAWGEGFANAIGEAMACGIPCVVTDVGDSAQIVGNTGKVVPPRNPEALAKAWQELIDLSVDGRKALGEAARARIIDNFSLESVVTQYESLYSKIAASK